MELVGIAAILVGFIVGVVLGFLFLINKGP